MKNSSFFREIFHVSLIAQWLKVLVQLTCLLVRSSYWVLMKFWHIQENWHIQELAYKVWEFTNKIEKMSIFGAI